MGINRTEHQDESQTEVSKPLRELYNVSLDEAFGVWKAFNVRKNAGYNSKDAFNSIRREKNEYDKIFDFLTVMMLETITADMIKEIYQIKED